MVAYIRKCMGIREIASKHRRKKLTGAEYESPFTEGFQARPDAGVVVFVVLLQRETALLLKGKGRLIKELGLIPSD